VTGFCHHIYFSSASQQRRGGGRAYITTKAPSRDGKEEGGEREKCWHILSSNFLQSRGSGRERETFSIQFTNHSDCKGRGKKLSLEKREKKKKKKRRKMGRIRVTSFFPQKRPIPEALGEKKRGKREKRRGTVFFFRLFRIFQAGKKGKKRKGGSAFITPSS